MQQINDANFNYALAITLKNEGGYCDNPHDSGGPTNYGISLKFLQNTSFLLLHTLIIQMPVTIDTIKNLSMLQISWLYYKCFWLEENYNHITNKIIAAKCFDMAVNMGAGTVNELLQKCINKLVPNDKQIAVDGLIGPQTLHYINTLDYHHLLDYLILALDMHYRELVGANPDLKEFLDGWLRRAAQ